jgi:hypothetical protein
MEWEYMEIRNEFNRFCLGQSPTTASVAAPVVGTTMISNKAGQVLKESRKNK